MSSGRGVRIGVDIGGTFTDVVVEHGGRRTGAKLLTTVRNPEQGLIDGILEALARAGLNAGDADLVVHGTTLAANALIERKGAKTALLTTAGHRDVLEIGTESRYDQYDLRLEKTPPLVPRRLRLPITERTGPGGEVLHELDEASVIAACKTLKAESVESLAIGFLHSYRNPAHELRAAELVAGELPGIDISLSSTIAPEIREYERISTVVANAHVRPLMRGYLSQLRERLADAGFACPVFMMLSSGGITTLDIAIEQPVRLVESGPAGGAAYAATVGRAIADSVCGASSLLAFDMGGTTAKVCLIDDFRPATTRAFEVARSARHLRGSGLPLQIPVVEMVEIGAGGGSMARGDVLGQVAVGPESTGSEPGPACYGRGGAMPTVTDADLVLGRLDPDDFAAGQIVLRPDLAGRAITEQLAGPLGLEFGDAARAVVATVDEHMANAVRVHCLEKGSPPSDRTMIVLGGAAPLHAGHIAAKLGIDRVVIPRDAGLGSAVGFLRAPVAFEIVRSLHQHVDTLDRAVVDAALTEAVDAALDVVRRADPAASPEISVSAFARYAGQGHELELDLHDSVAPDVATRCPSAETILEGFEAAYRDRFGRLLSGLKIEILSWRIVAGLGPAPEEPPVRLSRARTTRPAGRALLVDPVSGEEAPAPVWRRSEMSDATGIAGPALIREDTTTIVVPSGYSARLISGGHLLIEATGDQPARAEAHATAAI